MGNEVLRDLGLLDDLGLRGDGDGAICDCGASMAAPDFQAIFAATANAYMVVDRELRYVAANDAYLAVTASRFEDIRGRSLFEVFPNDPNDPNSHPALVLRKSLETVLRTKKRDVIAAIPYRVARVPGGPLEERLWSATHTPLFDDQGEVAFVLQHTSDVTEVHRLASGGDVLQRALAVQESRDALDVELSRMRQLFDQAPGFFAFLRGPEHIFEITNPAYDRLIGRSGILGKSVRDALPEIAGQGFYELLDRVFTTRQPYVGSAVPVTLGRAADGASEERVLDFMYQPIVGQDGSAIGIVVQGYDVTERVRVETRERFLARASEALATAGEGLDESLRRLGAIAVDAFADWCVIDLFDEHGVPRRVACARPGLEDLAHEAERYPVEGEVVPAHPTLRPDAMKASLVDWNVPKNASIARSESHRQWLDKLAARSVLGVPLVARGRRLGVLSFLISTTQRRFDDRDLAVAEELARMASTVIDNALLSRERTELLHLEQRARERAEAANRAKDEFLAMLGHELRNPLSPIVTAAQLMKLRGDASMGRERAIIERQAQHLVRLVDDLLDVSRITRGKITLQKQPTDMAGVIATAVEMASSIVDVKEHRLSLDVASEPLVVDGDAVRLSQVIANLLTNAARYTEPGGHISLRAQREGEEVAVRVKDDGVGISEDLLPQVFDMFVQGPRRADRPEGGLGLGLTLVRSLVALHGGHVEAHSEGPGRGSEFVVRLPMATHAPAPRASTNGHASKRTAPLRILVVDDNVDAAELLVELLEAYGHRTALAHDGPSALKEAERFAPDVALLDVGLPGMDGYELAKRIREALGSATPRLLAVTGYGQPQDRERSIAAGFDAHLVKPVDPEALLHELDRGATSPIR